MRKPFAMMDFKALHWPLSGFHLMRSRLRREGPEYTSLREWKCSGTGDQTGPV
jgi:2'-5' RNA ligase